MNIHKYQNPIAFNGKMKLIGNYTHEIKKAFNDNPAIQNLAKGKYDVIGIIKSREATKDEIYIQGRECTLYKFCIKCKNTSKKLGDKLREFFVFHKYSPTKNYHSDSTIIRIINDFDEELLQKELKI